MSTVVALSAEEEAEALKKLGALITPSSTGVGVRLFTIKPGDATHFPNKGDSCRIHYTGSLEDGTVFDSSRGREAIIFLLGQGVAIRGIDESVKLMSKNQIVRLTIPPMFGYGVNGYPPIVPPNATLTFEVELVNFSNYKPEPEKKPEDPLAQFKKK